MLHAIVDMYDKIRSRVNENSQQPSVVVLKVQLLLA